MTMYNPPRRHLLSQLGHVELLTPCVEKSAAFFHDLLGMEISATEGDSVYLRGWGEYFHHSIKLTQSRLPGLGHFSYLYDRARGIGGGCRSDRRVRAW